MGSLPGAPWAEGTDLALTGARYLRLVIQMPKSPAQARRGSARSDLGENTIRVPEIRWEAERIVHEKKFSGFRARDEGRGARDEGRGMGEAVSA